MANMPRSRSNDAVGPTARSAWTMTSVSVVVAEAVAARLELGAQLAEVVDLAVEDHLQTRRPRCAIGWCPPARSMMLRRRMPSPTPGSTRTPSSSGPRWRMTLHMSRTRRMSASTRPGRRRQVISESANPAIHTWHPQSRQRGSPRPRTSAPRRARRKPSTARGRRVGRTSTRPMGERLSQAHVHDLAGHRTRDGHRLPALEPERCVASTSRTRVRRPSREARTWNAAASVVMAGSPRLSRGHRHSLPLRRGAEARHFHTIRAHGQHGATRTLRIGGRGIEQTRRAGGHARTCRYRPW